MSLVYCSNTGYFNLQGLHLQNYISIDCHHYLTEHGLLTP